MVGWFGWFSWFGWLVSKSVSQSVENSINFFLKFRSNFLKAFRVDLKACLGLVYLTNIALGNCDWI